jgi:uridine kinase
MFIIGIAGGSGSGKTTFVNKIAVQLEKLAGTGKSLPLSVLHQDSYYLPSPPSELKTHGQPNFDHPNAFDWNLLKSHLTSLRMGQKIEMPVYDFRTNRRVDETVPVGPAGAILVEGIFTLWEPSIRSLFDVKVFLNVEADIRFIRRLHRDISERNRSIDSIIHQYYETVRPMHHEYLEPTRQFADLIVGEETDLAAEVIAAKIWQVLQ